MGLSLRAASAFVAMLGLTGQAQAATKLSQIFQSEMLDAQIAYLESITGPARHISSDSAGVRSREYPVEGCEVMAYAKDGAVKGYSLRLSPKCNFNLGNFLGNGYGSTKALTVGKLVDGAFGARVSGMRVQSPCIDLCDNSADATVDFTWEGPHAVDFISIVLTITLADERSLDALNRWKKAIREKESDDYIATTRFNCDNKYDAVALKAFANVPVNQITVGYEPHADFYKKSCG